MNKLAVEDVRAIAWKASLTLGRGDTAGGRFPPSLYYQFLNSLVEALEPDIAVELGVCGGGASYAMARANWVCRVIGVDITNDYPDNIAFIKAAYPHFTFMRMDSIDAASKFKAVKVECFFFIPFPPSY